jgi:uridylate kinase
MKRILIKLSGEQFGGESGKGIDTDVIQLLADDIKETLVNHEVELAIVVGGGNFVRGADQAPMFYLLEQSYQVSGVQISLMLLVTPAQGAALPAPAPAPRVPLLL